MGATATKEAPSLAATVEEIHCDCVCCSTLDSKLRRRIRSMKNKMQVITIGLIGAGKTTLLRKIQQSLPKNICLIPEPVDLFQQYKSFNPLELYYKEPHLNSGFCQLHILNGMTNHYEKILSEKPKNILTERNMFSSTVFTKTLRSLGYLSPFGEEVLLEYC